MSQRSFVENIKDLIKKATDTFEKRSVCYSIALHILLVALLIFLSWYVSSHENKVTLNLAPKASSNTPIVNASIVNESTLSPAVVPVQKAQVSEPEIQKPITSDKNTLALEALEKKLAEAKQVAFEKAKEQAREKAQKEREQKALEAKARIEKAQKEQEEKKREAAKQAKELAAKRLEKAAKEAKEAKEKEAKRQQAALDALRVSALNDLASEHAQAEQASLTERALQNYASEYKRRIESVWVMDGCRKIDNYKLPTVLVMANSAPKIVVSSGDSNCDRSLLLAFSNTQAPPLPADKKARELIAEGINFQFGQKG
ncbi:cell envelope integrity protein TolA [Fangia hongkongensis]|uniref:cell envelope integrity protein TolA n=1 Tax=Fangia hongkongensis TaxID=270495 RepID=UPI00037C3B2F|nr:cell envelope integrity protein TolA [Fangia hongkongensis]MBK2124109.1 cell envelope integrity protein TolA [Fangia hongkongensis]